MNPSDFDIEVDENARERAFKAHNAFMSGDIDGYQREKEVMPYMRKLGMTSLDPNDGDTFVSAVAGAESESELRSAFVMRDAMNNRDSEVMGRLEPGTRRIFNQGISKVKEGKRTVESFDSGIQRYRDATERTIRNSEHDKRSFGADPAEQGIEWQGGQLRSGSVRGETMPAEIAAFSFIDKYHRSSMPGNGIVPNVSIAGITEDGELVSAKVPQSIMQAIFESSAQGKQPDPRELVEWLDDMAQELDTDGEWDIYADDADTPIT